VLAATLLALGSAGLHAGWNLLIKQSGERDLTAWGQMLVGGLLASPLLLVVGLPGGRALAYLGVSVCVHVLYVRSLVRAYDHGDLSFSYPIARGGGALMAAVAGVVFLGDSLPVAAWMAITVVVAGLVSLVDRSVSPVAMWWALATAATIGTYTTLDAGGARASAGVGYVVTLLLVVGLVLTGLGAAAGRLPAFGQYLRRDWRLVTLGGLAGVVAYSMVMMAVRHAPVGYVAALRESSVVLGALGGWLVLGERLARTRVLSAAVVAVGLSALVLARPG
jgi:uncharacterized membrane protein